MEKALIVEAVIEAVCEIQEMSGRECSSIDATMAPIGEVFGFDSLNAIEAIIFIEETLGLTIANPDALFLSPDSTNGVTIETIALRIQQQFANASRKT